MGKKVCAQGEEEVLGYTQGACEVEGLYEEGAPTITTLPRRHH